MMQYAWPGNVRELENCIERAVALGSHETIDVHDLPAAVRMGMGNDMDLGADMEVFEEEARPVPVSPSAPDTDLEELERLTIQRAFKGKPRHQPDYSVSQAQAIQHCDGVIR